jgi:hypothetical protein
LYTNCKNIFVVVVYSKKNKENVKRCYIIQRKAKCP